MWMIHTRQTDPSSKQHEKKVKKHTSIELLWCILSHRREIATKNRPTGVDSEKNSQHIWFTNSHVNIWWLLFIVLPFERNVYNSSTASPKLNHSEKKKQTEKVNKRESITDKWNNQKCAKFVHFIDYSGINTVSNSIRIDMFRWCCCYYLESGIVHSFQFCFANNNPINI